MDGVELGQWRWKTVCKSTLKGAASPVGAPRAARDADAAPASSLHPFPCLQGTNHPTIPPPAASAFICLKLPLSIVWWIAWRRPKRADQQQHGAEGRPGRPQASSQLAGPCRGAGAGARRRRCRRLPHTCSTCTEFPLPPSLPRSNVDRAFDALRRVKTKASWGGGSDRWLACAGCRRSSSCTARPPSAGSPAT